MSPHRIEKKDRHVYPLAPPCWQPTTFSSVRYGSARGPSQSLAEAESLAWCGRLEKNPGHRSPRSPTQSRVSPIVFGKMADARGFVPALGDQATAQVHRPAQTQSLADLS